MTPIRILRHATPGAFRARAESWLLRQEAENNLVLGLAAQLETSMAGYEPVCDVVDYRFGRPPAGHEE